MNSYDHELVFKYELKQLMIKHNISFAKAKEVIDSLKLKEKKFMSKKSNNDYLNENIHETSFEELTN